MQICVPRNANQDIITTLTTICSPKLLKSLHHRISDHLTPAQVVDVKNTAHRPCAEKGVEVIIRSHHHDIMLARPDYP